MHPFNPHPSTHPPIYPCMHASIPSHPMPCHAMPAQPSPAQPSPSHPTPPHPTPPHPIPSLTNQPTNQPANQPANQPTNQPTNEPINQSTNQSINKPITLHALAPLLIHAYTCFHPRACLYPPFPCVYQVSPRGAIGVLEVFPGPLAGAQIVWVSAPPLRL